MPLFARPNKGHALLSRDDGGEAETWTADGKNRCDRDPDATEVSFSGSYDEADILASPAVRRVEAQFSGLSSSDDDESRFLLRGPKTKRAGLDLGGRVTLTSPNLRRKKPPSHGERPPSSSIGSRRSRRRASKEFNRTDCATSLQEDTVSTMTSPVRRKREMLPSNPNMNLQAFLRDSRDNDDSPGSLTGTEATSRSGSLGMSKRVGVLFAHPANPCHRRHCFRQVSGSCFSVDSDLSEGGFGNDDGTASRSGAAADFGSIRSFRKADAMIVLSSRAAS